MNIEQIELSLMKLFNKDKDIYQKRHIVFWYDENGDFKDDIDSLNLPNVTIHKLNDNFFYTKYLLESEDNESNYLIYSDNVKPNSDNNWFYDIFLYSQEFSADKSSVILNELWITNLELKETIDNHIKFFSSKKRTDEFIKLNLDKNNLKSVELSMLWVITWEKTINFDDILRKVILGGFEDNKVLEEFNKYDLSGIFWKYVKEIYWYNKEVCDLKDLFISFIISNINFSWEYELPLHLKWFSSCSNQSNVFINHFMNHKIDYKYYREISDEISNELDIFNKIVDNLNKIKNIETISWVDKTILLTITNSLKNKNTDFNNFIDIINLRKNKHWYDLFESQYEALLNAIKIFQFGETHNSWFNQITAKWLFEDYTNDLYKMDTYYRLFNYSYDKANLTLKNNYLSDLQKELEWVYTNWFLDELTKKQIALLKSENLDNWYVPWISKQSDFYEKEVSSILKWKNTERVFVIISDALRFECAKELVSLLEKERWTTSISSMQWVIPSYTKLWMASLLPHQNIIIDDLWRILVDNMDSTSTEWRNKILNKYLESVAITWKDLSSYSQNEARDIFRDKKVIYIYHNIIDSIWDDSKTEHKTFEACNSAIVELKDIVKKITNSWNGINVLITADHWFIYKREALVESDKISLEKVNKIDNNRRFILTRDEIGIDWTIKIDMWYIWNPWIKAILPNGNSRFKIQWWGSNFVHGSLTLQEIVIPIVNFKYRKDIKSWMTDFKKEVDIVLSNTNRVINSNIFTLVFHQSQAIVWKLLEGIYRVSLWDVSWNEPIIISDEKTIIADKTSDKIEDRMFKLQLTLKSWNYDKKKNYRLRIFSDWKVPKEKEWYDFTIDILIQNDFDSIF